MLDCTAPETVVRVVRGIGDLNRSHAVFNGLWLSPAPLRCVFFPQNAAAALVFQLRWTGATRCVPPGPAFAQLASQHLVKCCARSPCPWPCVNALHGGPRAGPGSGGICSVRRAWLSCQWQQSRGFPPVFMGPVATAALATSPEPTK